MMDETTGSNCEQVTLVFRMVTDDIKYKTESTCPVLLKTCHSYSKYRNSIIHGLKADDRVSFCREY